MTNENFRRELGHVFDEMSGSPSSALPDRVRSSIANAPEQKGPYWIAGVAATLIALVVIGVLFVGNPLKHQSPKIVPGTGPSPTATASPTPAAPFVCTSSAPITSTGAPAVVFIDSLQANTQAGYDQLTIGLQNGQPGSIELRPQSGTTFTLGASGQTVALAGKNGLLVVIHGADLHTSYSGSTDLKPGYPALVEVRQIEDFEGVVELGLGVAGQPCFRTSVLANPARLVIDIQAAAPVSPVLATQCRLPISWTGTGPGSLPMEGFMDLATGQVSDVPDAHLQVAGNNLAKSPGSPVLIGWPTGSSYYDAAHGRWLPALAAWVSPNGHSYAYLNFDASELHVVDVATGSDQVVEHGKRLYPLGWTADGLYVMDAITGAPVQVYSITVPGGRLTALGAKLSSVVPVSALPWIGPGHSGAWVAEVSSTVPHANGQNGPIANSISLVDLNTGQKVEWFSAANAAVSVLGFTRSGTPLVQSTDGSGTSIVRLTGPGAVAESYPLAHPAVGSATDSHGTWLLDDAGEALIYQEGTAPVLLASAPAGLIALGLAGTCAPQ
ncbi:MAG: hypothetical protein ACHQ0J_05480 [Candidatus Dormibacterales bacterium]